MSNKRLLGMAALVGGIILLYFGYNASQSVTESVAEAFSGRYTDETMAMLIGGAIATVLGLVMLLRK